MLVLAQTWKRLPSELAQRYMPELARLGVITPADWYAFDLAATARWADLRREAQEDERHGHKGAPANKQPQRPSGKPGAVHDEGERLSIRGNEIPPWDRRYRGSGRR